MIRRMQKCDKSQVMEIWLGTNLEAHGFVPEDYWRAHLEEAGEDISRAEVYVCEDETGVRGFIGLTGDYVAGIFVDKSVQSRGIGKQLLDIAKLQHGCLRLHVYEKNGRAVDFYEREGFRCAQAAVEEATGEKELLMVWERSRRTDSL